MKKHLIVIGIVFILPIVGFSGCQEVGLGTTNIGDITDNPKEYNGKEVTIPKANPSDWPVYKCFYWGRIINPVIEELPWFGDVIHCYAKSIHIVGFETGFGRGIYSDTLRYKDIIIPCDDYKIFALNRRIIGCFASIWIPQEYPDTI